MPWPIRPHLITPRVCHDLHWRVVVHCAGCRYATELTIKLAARSSLGATPLPNLLERGAFRCRRRCNGEPAYRVEVSMMNVGLSRTIAEWTIYDCEGRRSARLDEAS
jgi:hypothetical protein